MYNLPHTRNGPSYDELQIESLRQHAATCRIEERELIDELLKVKETELNCVKVEDSHSSSFTDFERTKAARLELVRSYLKSFAAIAETVHSEVENGLFTVQVHQVYLLQ